MVFVGGCSGSSKNTESSFAAKFTSGIITESYEGISLSVINISANYADVDITYPPCELIIYDSSFEVYRISKDNWVRVEFTDDIVNDLTINRVNSNCLRHLNFDTFYSSLPPGTYRFVQAIWVNVDYDDFGYDNSSQSTPFGFKQYSEPTPIYLYADFCVK